MQNLMLLLPAFPVLFAVVICGGEKSLAIKTLTIYSPLSIIGEIMMLLDLVSLQGPCARLKKNQVMNHMSLDCHSNMKRTMNV